MKRVKYSAVLLKRDDTHIPYKVSCSVPEALTLSAGDYFNVCCIL